jgi:hypothetical protein
MCYLIASNSAAIGSLSIRLIALYQVISRSFFYPTNVPQLMFSHHPTIHQIHLGKTLKGIFEYNVKSVIREGFRRNIAVRISMNCLPIN